MNLKLLTTLFSLMLTFVSCTDDTQNPDFPNKNVSLNIYPGTGAYFKLGAIGGWMYLNGGVNGILVYRNSENQFTAYDRACPYNPKDDCEQVEVQNGNSFILEDKCCGSEYLITTGEVSEGPSKYNLKYYYTNYDGNLLQIWN